MKARLPIRVLAFAASVFAIGALAPAASADAVYQTEHLGLTPVGGAPLRSGFVQNIKAEGPTIYAHEIYVLNGALPGETYTVTWNGYVGDPTCAGDPDPYPTGVVTTNAAGNARADAIVVPADVEGFQGEHGVIWTFRDSYNELVYTTTCTKVTID